MFMSPPDLPVVPTPANPPVILKGESLKRHIKKSWEWFESIGSPKYHVAPMVD